MAGFFAELKQNAQHCDVFYLDSLSYLQHFVVPEKSRIKSANKLILLCKEKATDTDTYRPPTRPERNRVAGIDLNLTGSPLKDSFNYDTLDDSIAADDVINRLWTDTEAKYHPLSLPVARKELNNISMSGQHKTTPVCWAICESVDDEHEDGDKELMISMSYQDGRLQRGILAFNNFVQFEDIDILTLQAKHNAYTSKHSIQQSSTVDTFYDVCLSAERIMNLQVTHALNGVLTQSEISKNKSALEVTLHQSIRVSNLNSPAWKLWRQLDQLHTIKENIHAYKEYEDSQYLKLNIMSDSDFTEIKEEVLEIMGGHSDYQFFDPESEAADNKAANIEHVVRKVCDRECALMTDQLWEVLKRCSSYDMLVDAFQCIFKLAVGINIVNMPTSTNKLSQLIRDISDQRLAIPRIGGSEPLELLLEIGLEKLRKDYELIFTECKLCSVDDLRIKREDADDYDKSVNLRQSLRGAMQPNAPAVAASTARKTLMQRKTEYNPIRDDAVGLQNSNFDLVATERELTQLAHIHLTLEHLMSIESKMNITNGYANFLEDLRKPLVPFDQLKDMDWDKRRIVINNAKILQQISNNGEMPTQFRVNFKSYSNYKRIYSTFFFTMEPIFPPNLFKCIPVVGAANNTVETVKEYFAFHYLNIETV